jgi:hypothetical protein
VVRVAAELLADDVQLLVGDAQLAVERLGSGGLSRSSGLQRHRAGPSIGPPASHFAALSTSERMSCIPSSLPRIASDIRSGCGISPATLPAALQTPAIARSEPFGLAGSSGVERRRAVVADVAEEDLAVALELVQRRLVGVVAALAVGDRHAQRLAGRGAGERRVEPLGLDVDEPAGEPQRAVAQQRARAPGPASARTWKPLQMPSTRPPSPRTRTRRASPARSGR